MVDMPGRILPIGVAQLVTPGAPATPSQTTVLPPALAVLAAGSVLQGKVAGRDSAGNLIIQLAQGSEVHLKSNLPLPAGSEVSLRFDQVQGQQAARIITVNGKPLAEWVQAQPPHLIPDDIIDLSSQTAAKSPPPPSASSSQAAQAQGETKQPAPLPPPPPEITLRANVQPGTVLRGQLQPQMPMGTQPQQVATPFRETANLVSRYTALPASTAATPSAPGEAKLPLVSFRVIQIALPNGQVLNYDASATPPAQDDGAANPATVIRNLATLFKTAMQNPANQTPAPPTPTTTPAPVGTQTAPLPQTPSPLPGAAIPAPAVPSAAMPAAATLTAPTPGTPLLSASATQATPMPAPQVQTSPSLAPTATPSPGQPSAPTPTPATIPQATMPPSVPFVQIPATPSPMPGVSVPGPTPVPASIAPQVETLEFVVPKPAGSNDAPVMLQSPKGTLVLEVPLHLPPGTRITLLPLLVTAPQVETPPAPMPGGQANSWAGLSSLLGGKENSGALPPAVQAILDKLPKADGQLAVKMLPFLLAGQGRAEPLPEIAQMLRGIEAQHPQAARGAQEMLQAAQMQQQTREAAPWQSFFVPVYDGHQVQEVRWYMKRKERKEYEEEDDTTRFIIELFLSQTGMLQLDGLFRVKEKSARHFDLILRSHKAMPKEMQQEIARIFSEAMEETKMQGGVQFAVVPEFPVKPAEEIAASQRGSILA